MNCHMRGAFAPAGSPNKANYLTDAATDPGAIGGLSPDNPIFSDLVMTDFQWSLPNRAGNPPTPPPAGAAAGGQKGK